MKTQHYSIIATLIVVIIIITVVEFPIHSVNEVKITGSKLYQDTSENNMSITKSTSSVSDCVAGIANQTIFSGYAGSMSCPAVPSFVESCILNYSGFYKVNNILDPNLLVGPSTYIDSGQESLDKSGDYRSEGNFVLEPGHNATITYTMTQHIGHCERNCPPELIYPTKVNYTNIGEFIHREKNEILHSHDGLEIKYEPESESLGDNQTITLKATITASSDVPRGTYWVILTPGNCQGGPLILLTVSDCKK